MGDYSLRIAYWGHSNSEEAAMGRPMFKLKATDEWYRHAAEMEKGNDIGAGLPPQGGIESQEDLVEKHRKEYRQAAYAKFVHMLRINARLTIDALAKKLTVDPEQLLLMEQQLGYKAPPRTLTKLAKHYNLPIKPFFSLAGAYTEIDRSLEQNVIRFAAESDSFEKLTDEEKRLLNELVKVLRDYEKCR